MDEDDGKHASHIPVEVTYQTIRQEVLDQKRCQFQLFSVALTLTVAIIAYAGATHIISPVYMAPIVMNDLALVMILHKAASIQRMCGYLRFLELNTFHGPWMWEVHLDYYRCLRDSTQPSGEKVSGARRHTYVTTVSAMVILLNIFCGLLYLWGPAIRSGSRPYGWIDVFVAGFFVFGLGFAWYGRHQLIVGHHSTEAVMAKWQTVFKHFQRITGHINGCVQRTEVAVNP